MKTFARYERNVFTCLFGRSEQFAIFGRPTPINVAFISEVPCISFVFGMRAISVCISNSFHSLHRNFPVTIIKR